MDGQPSSPVGRRRRPDTLAIVAHEVRGPLGVVMTFAEMLLAKGLEGEVQHVVSLMRLAAQQALGVTDDLLADASLGQGNLRLAETTFDPATLARDLVALFAPIVDADRRRIDLRLARRLPDEMRSDPARIRQILFNLVSNASRHTTVGNVTLAVHRGRNGRIVFDVLDDGPGLPPDFRFRPFARGSGPKAGSGLGLWISARLAAALGGRLTMTARPEGGTRARLTLPASPQPARPPRRAARQAASPAQLPAAPLAAAPAAPAEAPGPLAGLSALVVDDSAVSRMLMTTILGSFGLAVTTADDSAEATAHCVRRAPDLIFVDWTLRGETGAAVIEHIAAVCGARPPAVLITAETRISAEGFAARVRKPFSPRELYDATLTALGAATRDAAHGA